VKDLRAILLDIAERSGQVDGAGAGWAKAGQRSADTDSAAVAFGGGDSAAKRVAASRTKGCQPVAAPAQRGDETVRQGEATRQGLTGFHELGPAGNVALRRWTALPLQPAPGRPAWMPVGGRERIEGKPAWRAPYPCAYFITKT
jgi:hypothetical protein